MNKMEKILRKIEDKLPYLWSFLIIASITGSLLAVFIFVIKLILKAIGVI